MPFWFKNLLTFYTEITKLSSESIVMVMPVPAMILRTSGALGEELADGNEKAFGFVDGLLCNVKINVFDITIFVSLAFVNEIFVPGVNDLK